MSSSMQGKVAIVTGGGSGIGRALSVELARRGATVHVTDVNGATAAETARTIGGSAKSAALDVRDAAAVQKFCDGVGRVDYLFNNAGIAIGGEIQDLTLAHWDRILDINVRGVIHGIQAVYPGMIARGSGHIVNTASVAGLLPMPLGVPYGMTKHAVVGLSVGLRWEAEAYGVRVSALCPGVIETPILDSLGPSDLPRPKWLPDGRELLTKTAGAPYPAERLAHDALDAVERNVSIIIVPTRAKLMVQGYKMAPWVAEALAPRMLKETRKSKGR
jgi:NAD(P)-dependent dehydrogenase (short-subunit alcohol dehydrogenase family)